MAKSRQQKEADVEEFTEKFRRMKGGAFISVHGFTMKDADALRAKGKAAGVDVAVAKKTILKLAADQAGISGFDPSVFDGSILAAFSFDDEVAGARLLASLAKEKDQMKLLGGILEHVSIDAVQVKNLSALPGKRELLGRVLGSIQSPVSGFVNVLAGNIRGLVTVLHAIQEEKGKATA
ncbi:MAG TPA: 50S ribosomal protein L10 [Patescibacteria group bacterium]|nr:50S ribosomal protein L10 [Patescibacteria group bacterium]